MQDHRNPFSISLCDSKARMSKTAPAQQEEVWREDFVSALAALTLVLGLFLDGWNHINLQNGAHFLAAAPDIGQGN